MRLIMYLWYEENVLLINSYMHSKGQVWIYLSEKAIVRVSSW